MCQAHHQRTHGSETQIETARTSKRCSHRWFNDELLNEESIEEVRVMARSGYRLMQECLMLRF